MANPEHLEILRNGLEEWNRWRSDFRRIKPDLSRADLGGADLRGADLRRANLGDVNLRGAFLTGANLSGANLNDAGLHLAHLAGADFRRANLRLAHLIDTDLSEANLGDANLYLAQFGNTGLAGTNLASACFGWTKINDVDLSEALGLETAVHYCPSSVGIDTIYKSKGRIPESFLRGAGVPDVLINFLPSLIGPGIEFYSCFISYSHRDEEFCKRLHSAMQAEHLRVWYAPEDMPGGRKLHEEIETQIRLYDKLLLVLSDASMESEWVGTEIYHARQREIREERQILFPIRLCPFEEIREWRKFDADSGKDMAREIRGYFIPDFSNWKEHDAFESSFARLLKDLRGKAAPPPPTLS
jgi:TIR domain/Pentapeptide repeats (8 copies)